MLAWVAPLFVFGIVVFVHELGHFLAAKAAGVYAPRFSIGFGKALIRKRWGETEYVLAALPLGGYVRMASRDDEATAFIEGGSENATTQIATKGEPLDPNAMMPFGPKPIQSATCAPHLPQARHISDRHPVADRSRGAALVRAPTFRLGRRRWTPAN